MNGQDFSLTTQVTKQTVKTNNFSLGKMSPIDCTISHVCLTPSSLLNQSESHVHKECEIYINLTGDVSFEVENRIYPITRGSVIITRPYEYHHCLYHSDQPHEHLWITFLAEESEDFLKIFFERKKGEDNLILLSAELLAALSSVLAELQNKETNFLNRRIAFLQLFSILMQGKREAYTGINRKIRPDVEKALQYMDDHLTEDLNLHLLSVFCKVSANTLERHFKEDLGKTPFVMLRQKRLYASMQYLRNGDSVSEAATKSGFSDYSNYIQLFRKQFGLTPLMYKKNYELQ